jgi:hypothetical protein
MNGKRTLLVAFVVVAAIVVTIQGIGFYRVRQNRAATIKTMEKVNNYNRGFGNGVNAVLKYVKFDTNTGTFTLELTNVLAEMKP